MPSLLLFLVLQLHLALAASPVAKVASSSDLLLALLDANVHTVQITRDFALEAEHWPAAASEAEYLHVTRDVSVVSAKGLKSIDLGFRRPTVAVGGGATLQVRGLHFKRSANYAAESHSATASDLDHLVPFFTHSDSGRLLFQEVSAEAVEEGLLHLHVEHLRSNRQNATIVGEETCRAAGVSCPLGAVWIKGDVRMESSSLDEVATDVYDCLHVFIHPDQQEGLEQEEQAVVESLVGLHEALRDDSVRWIYLVDDIVFETKAWPNMRGSLEDVVILNRRVLIATHPWLRPQNRNPASLDLDLKFEKLEVAEDAQLHIKGITLLKSRSSYGHPVDIGFLTRDSAGQITLEEVTVEVPLSRDVIDRYRILKSSSAYQHVNSTECTAPQSNGVHECKGVIRVNGEGNKVQEELVSLPGALEQRSSPIAFDLATFVLVDQSAITSQEENYLKQGIRLVNTELELMEALKNNQISLVYLSQNLRLSEDVWGSLRDKPITLNHSIVLTSRPGAVMLVLDFNALKGRVQPSEGVAVRLQSLDLGTLIFDVERPDIKVPFFSLAAGGSLSIVDSLAFTEIRQELKPLHPMEPGRKCKVELVTNDECRDLAGISCVDKAIHVQQWLSLSSKNENTMAAIGEVRVKNMLIVATRELSEEIGHVHGYIRKGRAWTSAAIGLGIATAVLLAMLIVGAVVIALKRYPTKQRKTEGNRGERKQESSNKSSSAVPSIRVDSTEQAATPPPATPRHLS